MRKLVAMLITLTLAGAAVEAAAGASNTFARDFVSVAQAKPHPACDRVCKPLLAMNER